MVVGSYTYGTCQNLEGLCVGVARQVPRGIRKEAYVSGGFFDVWLPILAPSSELVRSYQHGVYSTAQFFRRYRAEMRQPDARHVITFLAATALRLPLHLGCFCEDEASCHRSVLRELVIEALEELPSAHGESGGCASPPCSMPDPEV